MMLRKIYLFVEKNNRECNEVEELLLSLNVPYEKIYVDENHVKGLMLREYGTTKVPMIATLSEVVIGAKNVKEFIKRNFNSEED